MRLNVPSPLSPPSLISSLSPLSTPSHLSPPSTLSPPSPLSLPSPLSPLSPLSLPSKMDFNPFQDSAKFVELLNSQQKVVFGSQGSASRSSSQVPFFSQGTEEGRDLPAERKERRAWTPTDDIVLISSWLNTSKDLVVGNEQNEKRGGPQCKQRWHKLNEAVCKFCGAYEAATREKSSGMNENDIVKLAHEIFFNNYKKKFTLEHAWKELRHDQKWCEVAAAKNESTSKRRKFEDGSQSASSQVPENPAAVDGTSRPSGVKASKARGKNPQAEEKRLSDFQSMWSIKQNDLAMKERLSKLRILENLLAKDPPLADYEEVIMKKLINELMSTTCHVKVKKIELELVKEYFFVSTF
ncbi:glutathione S-transferase T3-like [Brassica napus]|uniref:glutathione S-transferase T3-like n=1 Tax=Brassica napus TaxID=3708 RepID=UPI0020789222|nr:glutathione S-transferase T3-like [Brassica napus]